MSNSINDSNRSYIPELDGLRALALLSVLFYHMDFLPFLQGGFTGVDIFFVLSGYVISRSIFQRGEKGFTLYLGEFYKRRIIRILPALFTCLIVTQLFSILFIPFSWKNELIHNTGFSALFGYSNFTLVFQNDGYFSPHADYNPFLHSWSLGVEEQFYLFFPLIFFLWLRFRKQKNMTGIISRIILPVLTLTSLGLSVHASATHHDRGYYLLHSRFWELASGALLFQFQSRKPDSSPSRKWPGLLFFPGLLLTILGILFSDPWAFPFPWALLPVTGTLLMINAVTAQLGKYSADLHLLNNPFMLYLGRISYSLYLWHWPVITMLRWTVGYNTPLIKILSLTISFLLAAGSFHFIEKPLRQNRLIKNLANWKIISAGLMLVLAGLGMSQWMFSQRESLSMSKTKNIQEWLSGGWYGRDEAEQPLYDDPELQSRQIFVMGDSHTAAYRTMLHMISSRLGIQVREYESGGCGVADLLSPMGPQNIQHYKDSLEEIKTLAHPGDILFLASLRMPELSNRFEKVDIADVLEQHYGTQAQKEREIARDEADVIITELEELGLTVLISAPEPVLLIPPYRCSDWFNRSNPIGKPGPVISTELLKEIRQPMMETLNYLQLTHPKLEIWDPMEVLCTGPTFSAYDSGGLPLFYDGDHLSAHGNRVLEPSFEEKVLEIWR